LYSYVGNNPVNFVDPTGHVSNLFDLAGGDVPITPVGPSDIVEGITSDPGGEPMLPPSSGGETETAPAPNVGVQFSNPPTASELRAWGQSQGYKLLLDKNGIETWEVEDLDGWRLKLKQPSITPGIDPGSQVFRYSARTEPGTYYDPVTDTTGTRSELGHLLMSPE
jgi:hypothetical protein